MDAITASQFLIACGIFITAALGVMLLIAASNAVTFPRLRHYLGPDPLRDRGSPVSVLIPARQEEERIGNAVRSLLAQDYKDFEIIVLDDDSSDTTYETALQAAGGDSRVRVIRGKPLAPGWAGKNWACSQLAEAARHNLLVFTDADVTWQPEALRAVVAAMNQTGAGLLTVWPTQITEGWAERLVVPLMAFAVLAYLPYRLVSHTPFPSASAATGQCMAFRRTVYCSIGGHAAVKSSVLEDVQLAQLVKQQGYRLVMADGSWLLLCRMYVGVREVVDGYTKNILAGHKSNIAVLAASTLFHIVVFVLPAAWFAGGFFVESVPAWPIWPLALYFLAVSIRALTAVISCQRPVDALFMPISVLIMTYIALRATWWQFRYGGPTWKGRRISSGGRLS